MHLAVSLNITSAIGQACLDFSGISGFVRKAEAVGIDMVVLTDSLPGSPRSSPFEATTLLAALATVTSRIGLVANASTLAHQPYNLARRFASLDIISHGRIGWNATIAQDQRQPANFSRPDGFSEEDFRRRAEEFIRDGGEKPFLVALCTHQQFSWLTFWGIGSVIGNNAIAVAAAEREARRQGLRARVLTTRLEGEAREAARVLVAVLRECVETGRPAATPVCLLAGGETTVTVRGPGRGGRNQEIAVAAVDPLSRFPAHAVVASLATDGVDGASDAAGGVVDQETAREAAALGLAPAAAFLAASDSTSFLGPLGGLIVTGPTGTNVVDLTVLLAGDARPGRARG